MSKTENIENAYDALMLLKVQELVSLIIDNKVLEFRHALDYLYRSKLYEALSNENTKIWHLSSEKLLEMLEKEKLTNELLYPDFV